MAVQGHSISTAGNLKTPDQSGKKDVKKLTAESNQPAALPHYLY